MKKCESVLCISFAIISHVLFFMAGGSSHRVAARIVKGSSRSNPSFGLGIFPEQEPEQRPGDGIAELLLRGRVSASQNKVNHIHLSDQQPVKEVGGHEFIDWERIFANVASSIGNDSEHILEDDVDDIDSSLGIEDPEPRRPWSVLPPTQTLMPPSPSLYLHETKKFGDEGESTDSSDPSVKKRSSRECEQACSSFCLANFASVGGIGRSQKRHLYGCIEQCKRQRCRWVFTIISHPYKDIMAIMLIELNKAESSCAINLRNIEIFHFWTQDFKIKATYWRGHCGEYRLCWTRWL